MTNKIINTKCSKPLFYLIVLLTAIACNKKVVKENEYPFNNIRKEVLRVAESNEGKLNISKLTPFEWEVMYVFRPYSLMENSDNDLEFEWKIPENITILHDETDNLLVFTKNNEVVSYIQWPRNIGDFIKTNPSKFSCESANFIMKKEKYGNKDKVFIYHISTH